MQQITYDQIEPGDVVPFYASPGTTPYQAVVMAMAHAMLGVVAALAAIWNTPVHEDATALTNLVTTLNELRGL